MSLATSTSQDNADLQTGPGEIVSIEAQATATAGRYLVSARHNVLPTDAKVSSGGPGLAIAAGELCCRHWRPAASG